MKIKMKAAISGPRDGVDWPAPGETIVVPDEEAAELCAAGMASPVTGKDDDVEYRDDEKPKRGPGRPAGSRNKPKDE